MGLVDKQLFVIVTDVVNEDAIVESVGWSGGGPIVPSATAAEEEHEGPTVLELRVSGCLLLSLHWPLGISYLEPNTTTNSFFPQFYQAADPSHQGISMDFSVHESSSLEHSTKNIALSNNEHSVANKQSPDSSSVVLDQKLESGEQVTQKVLTPINKRKYKNGFNSLNSAQSKDTREVLTKGKKQKKSNAAEKKPQENKKVVEEAPPTGYIHVRARRGQATDSHSLAERVRREKISERMKLLQAIVPGCDKVTGKALMLDEIINYVQSLQNQVEFLSMKLASVNPMFYDFGVDLDSFMVKPDQNLSSLEPPMTNVQQCNPTAAANTFTTSNNYPLLDSSAASSLLLQQGQISNILSQSNGHVFWRVDDQRQKLIDQSGLSNNLCSLH